MHHCPGSRRTAAAVLLVVASLAPGGCTTRDRLNPLDPENRATHGFLPGFDARAGDGVVELRWNLLPGQAVASFQLERWSPGETPRALPGFGFGPQTSIAEDSTAVNGTTYVYRVRARFGTGDSAVSLPDSATPGGLRIFALSAGLPAMVALTPDARDILFVLQTDEPYEDMEFDSLRGTLWLSQSGVGRVVRRAVDGSAAGVTISAPGVSDVSIGHSRGVGWVATPIEQRVSSYGPDLLNPNPTLTVGGLGHPRICEAGSIDGSVWVGNDEGRVIRLAAPDGSRLGEWSFGAPVTAIALDEPERAAWVTVRRSAATELHRIDAIDSTAVLVRGGLSRVADLAVDANTGSVWISERGVPGLGAGRLTRVAVDGTVLVSVAGIEPFGIAAAQGTGGCWISDLKSQRLLEVDASGAIVRRSTPISVPYAVRVDEP